MEAELPGQRAAITSRYWREELAPGSTTGKTLYDSGGTVTKAEISFATDKCYYFFSPGKRVGCLYFPLILMHELAHVYGLDHVDEFSSWNLDTDDNPDTAINIDCDDPTAGLRYSSHIAKDSYTAYGLRLFVGDWYRLSADDRAGRDFLYPPNCLSR
jgi:hypothetical protein